eukprot:TRINITY_DN22771_c0_g1_i1.p1 TRINITY_DN22771_c0_g1~~TRINITY_DN22771_c0_g1_i1.p1  ORF type:complete len:544 (+),score=141.18 TRINITY_DN22771_c0_g1_i1:112-1743(+)
MSADGDHAVSADYGYEDDEGYDRPPSGLGGAGYADFDHEEVREGGTRSPQTAQSPGFVDMNFSGGDSALDNSQLMGYSGGHDFADGNMSATYRGDVSWSKSSLRPENQASWQQKTVDTLNTARALARLAQRNVLENSMAGKDGQKKSNSSTYNVQNTIKKKMNVTGDLVKGLEDRVASMEDTIRQVGESLFSLQRAYRSKWSPLNVCERRLELRDSRPLQELIRDHCQEALEHERTTLIEARQELADQIESSKTMLVNLESTKAMLVQDLQLKRQSLRIDRTCLSPQKMKTQGAQTQRLVLPQLGDVVNYAQPPSPLHADKESGPANDEHNALDTRGLITNAVRLEEEAMRLCNASDAAMIHTKRECGKAGNMSLNALARRVDETDELKRKLEAQLADTDEAITQTEISLNQTKKKLDAHEVPLNTLDKQFAMRSKKSTQEGIRDAVHEELETQLETVKKNVKLLTIKFQNTRDVLEQLRSSKKKMQDDHRMKLSALKIDDTCMKVTPRKAIELDRMDPRGGRCIKPSRASKRSDFLSASVTM